MIEEPPPAGPEPPDIRPSGRHTGEQYNANYSGPRLGPKGQDHVDRAINNPGRVRNFIASLASTKKSPTLLVLFLALCSVSGTTAQHVDSFDPFTSYPSSSVNTSGRGSGKSTPLLSSLKWILQNVSALIAYITGFDLHQSLGYLVGAIKGHDGLHKRADTIKIVEGVMIPVLVVLSGIFAGLTLGYFSVDPTQLQVLSISGTAKQQEYARRIIPVRKDSHLLLTTLILCNMIVNEALPEVADKPLGGGVQAVIASTALVVIFAEIIPQSVCSRYGLLIGATMAKPVRVLIYFWYPIGWPVAKLLEWILGAHHGIIYRRSELRELIKFHAMGGEGGGDLDYDTVTMAQGALDLAQKSVREAMTPIDRVFMLPIEAKLDYETLGMVVKSGHSRVPVYQMVEVPDVNLSAPSLALTKTKMVKKVLGSLLVKSCVLLDPEDATPLASIPINAIPSVPCDEPLTNMLNVFQEGRSHMAIVSRRPRRRETDPEDAESVITAAAGGLRERSLRKVATITHGDRSSSSDDSSQDEKDLEKGEKLKRKKSRKVRRKKEKSEGVKAKDEPESSGSSSGSPLKPPKEMKIAEGEEKKPKSKADEIKAQVEAEKRKRSFAEAAKLTQLEQNVPSDAQLPPHMVEKFFEGLEGAPLGIITLEDVLEELIGEEIYDEYDDNGGPNNPASAFIPREAAMAARQAAMDREKALAEATPLPPTNDADIDRPPPPVAQPSRRYVPKLPLPRFSRGKRPTSQPGKSRSADEKQAAEQPGVAAPPPRVGLPSEEPAAVVPAANEDKSHPDTSHAESSEQIQLDGNTLPLVTTPLEIDMTDYVQRSKSDRGARRQGSLPTIASGSTVPAPLSGHEPVSSVPARLLSGGPVVPGGVAAPPSNANLLSEALLMERGRRRLAAQHGVPIGAVRIPSTGGLPRSGVPSRQPTPPSGTAGPASTMLPPTGPTTGSPSVPSVLSPLPMHAKRGTKFKSVPTPIGTPRIGGPEENPMEKAKMPEDKE